MNKVLCAYIPVRPKPTEAIQRLATVARYARYPQIHYQQEFKNGRITLDFAKRACLFKMSPPVPGGSFKINTELLNHTGPKSKKRRKRQKKKSKHSSDESDDSSSDDSSSDDGSSENGSEESSVESKKKKKIIEG